MAQTEPDAGGKTKGKKPPSFPHVHPDRAKKFKKAWIEKAKIKSQWKTQKRKEGLVDKTRLDLPVYDDQEGTVLGGEESDQRRVGLTERTAAVAGDSTESSSPPQPQSSTDIQPRSRKGKAKQREVRDDHPSKRQSRKRKLDAQDESTDQQEEDNVRELMRTAYSKSSLHTFKADPLKRRGDPAKLKGKGERGRGQPDMKLRMNAMLAKIKQDYA